jgi:hypothetical protein
MLNQKQSDLEIGQPTENMESEFLGWGISDFKWLILLAPGQATATSDNPICRKLTSKTQKQDNKKPAKSLT